MEFWDLKVEGGFMFELDLLGHNLVASPEVLVPLARDVIGGDNREDDRSKKAGEK